jgi:hypothetical protein
MAPATVNSSKRLEEALEREAVTAEILEIISSSPANLEPVFDAIVLRQNGDGPAAHPAP